MKFNKNIWMAGLLAASFACSDSYIDDIKYVDPGPDETAPEVMINYPAEGTLIRVAEDVTSIDIDLEVIDDIEIQDITIMMDGTEIGMYDSFKDYRRALIEHPFDNVTNGEHELTVVANDLSGKMTSSSVNFEKVPPYVPVYDGEVFYMPFDGDYLELVSVTEPTVIGSPDFADESVQGLNAYKGATDSYLRISTNGLLNEEFTAVFWYKINPSPNNGGILTIGPEDTNNPDAQNNRTNGFRLFREGSATWQTFKLNVGNGTSDSWFDGRDDASIDPTVTNGWIHLAFTISSSSCALYINGEVVSQGDFSGIGWEGCDILSIASGAPRFTEWGHLSDLSFMDELRIFNRALSQQEIQTIIATEQP